MITKDLIITEIYNSKIIEKCSSSFTHLLKSYREDFIQEMYIIILNMDEEKLFRLYNDKQIYFYIVKVIKNNATNFKSPFYTNIVDTRLQTLHLDQNIYENL